MAFTFPDQFLFADNHEYAALDGDLVRVGISAFAVDQLGDIVFVDLPEIGRTFSVNEVIAFLSDLKCTLASPVKIR